jgi:hypothetical protein
MTQDEKIQESLEQGQTIEELRDSKTVDVKPYGLSEVELAPEVEPVVTPKTWIVVFVSQKILCLSYKADGRYQIMAMGYGLCFWPVPVFAAIGSQVAASKGDAAKASWFVPSWTLAITVCFMIW